MAVKKARRPNGGGSSLNINSMMDMMTIILVFLLKSYSTTDVSVAASDELELPFSSALKAPEVAVNLVVEQGKILVDGVPTVNLTKVDDAATGQKVTAVPEDELRGQTITRLYDVLLAKAEEAKRIGEASGKEDLKFKGRILIQVDKDMPFSVVRTVMYTAGQAQFGEFKFIVYKME